MVKELDDSMMIWYADNFLDTKDTEHQRNNS